jgi:microcystin-dependent protein
MSAYIGEIILVAFNFPPAGYVLCNGALLPIAEYDALFALIGTTYGGDGQTTFAVPDLRGRVAVNDGSGGGSTYFLGETGGAESVTVAPSQMPPHSHAIDISGLTATARCRSGAADQVCPAGAVHAMEAAAPFTEPSLVAGTTPMRALHISELRSRIDTMRARYSMGPFPYTTSTLTAQTTMIRAQHILDLRTALAAVYGAAGLMSPVYTDPDLSSGATIKAAHVTELRNAVLAVPGGGGVAAPYSSAAPDASMSGAVGVSGTATAEPTGGVAGHENRQPYLTLNYCIATQGIFPNFS